ncbi:MAG: iron-containing alcohol dehydrogenase [Kiritimatiellaceae bacterium]|nr:iron-containing alcohol dehydrogenase [Kiritimatiellaceae bacterium]
MKAFEFHNPTHIVFGNGCIDEIGEKSGLSGKRILLVYGQNSIKRNGVYDRIIKSLTAAGITEIVEYPGVRPNPVLSHLKAGIELAKTEKVEAIVAVGGGSVIDEAKGIAAGALYDGDIWGLYNGSFAPEKALPLVAVLTIPATGSEMNGGAVITNDETREKFGAFAAVLYPKVSFMDPEITHSLPADYTAYGAVDAISHLIEGYFTGEDAWSPIQDRYVEGLVKTIMEATDRILANLEDNDARATLMWAATLAWNGLAPSGVGAMAFPNHMIEHPLSGRYNVAHGAGLSIVIPAWMRFAVEKNPAKFAQFAANVFGIEASNEKEQALNGVDALKAWFQKIGSPVSLAESNIPAEDIPQIADDALHLGKAWGMTDYSKEDVVRILTSCASVK